MKKNRFLGVLCALILLCSFFLTACGNGEGEKEKETIGAEVGKWHGEFALSDINENGMSDEDKAMFAVLAGDIVFEIDVEFCADGTFSYILNTDKLEEAFSKSISTFSSMIFDFDISLFTDRIVKAALKDVMKTTKSDYLGKYTKSGDGIITAIDEEKLLFKVTANRLIQIDENGTSIIKFTKAEPNS